MKAEDVYYNALLARDYRFDGKFFVAVKTTGIYCRPICPARPKRENVTFFTHPFEAEKSGYRPCLRCRPESAPRSPAWIGKTAIVQRAVKKLHSQDSIEWNEDEFAELFGVSARHLRRLFIDEIGKTPKQLAFENRLGLARGLIVETSLPVSEVAFASGFTSIRRFNDAFKDRFKKSPTEIRRSPLAAHRGQVVSLSYRPPFDFEGLLRSYESHKVGRLEWFENGKMHRVISRGQKVGKIVISNDSLKSRLLVEIDFPDTSAIHWIVTRVRSLFDLDSDPVIIANSLEMAPRFKALLKEHPGVRLPSGWDPFETAVGSILGQLVSVERGRALVHDLIEMLGEESRFDSIKLFPTPKQIAGSSLDGLKTTRMRKQTLIGFSRAILDGKISLEPTQDVEEFVKKVRTIKGIGPWTAGYITLKVLRHTDAFPETDLVLAKEMKTLSKESLTQISPWRGYAAALLWREYAGKTQEKKR